MVLLASPTQARAVPTCPQGHLLSPSDFAEGGYSTGWQCDRCTRRATGTRWHCVRCAHDLCLLCEPSRRAAPVLPAPSVVAVPRLDWEARSAPGAAGCLARSASPRARHHSPPVPASPDSAAALLRVDRAATVSPRRVLSLSPLRRPGQPSIASVDYVAAQSRRISELERERDLLRHAQGERDSEIRALSEEAAGLRQLLRDREAAFRSLAAQHQQALQRWEASRAAAARREQEWRLLAEEARAEANHCAARATELQRQLQGHDPVPAPVPVPVPVPAAPAAPQREGGAELAAHHAASVTAACGSLAGEVAALRFALQSTDAESARLRAALAASPARQEAPPSPPPQPPEGSPPQPPAGPTRPAPLQVPCEPTHAARSGASTATPTAGSVRGGRDMGHSSPALAALASAWSFRREYPGSACPQEAPAAAAAAPAAAGEGTATLAEVPAAAERREWRKGDAVRVVSDLGAARRAQPSWVDAMDATAGQAGVVTKVIEPGPGGDVLCRVAGREWIYAMDNLDEDHGPAVTPQLSAAGASGWTVGGSGQAATDPAAPGSPPNMTEDTREQTAAACGRNLSARSAAAGAALPASISASALSMLPMPGGAAEHSAREPAVTAASPASASFASSAARPHSIAATPYGEVSMRIAHASMMSVAPPPAIGSLSLLSVQCPTGDLSTRAGLPSSTASAAPPAGESEQRGEQSQRSPSCSSGSLRGASAGRLPTSAADARDPGAPPAVSIVTLEPPDWDESVRAAAAAAALPASAISAQPHGASTRAAAAAAALPASALSAAPPGRSVERGAAAQPPQLAASAAAPDGAESVRGAAAVAALPQSVVSQAPPGQSLRAAGAAAALPESAVSSPPQRGGSPPAAAAPPAAPPEGGRPPLRKGDAVLVEADPAAARRAQPSWVAAMDSATGQQGVVTKVLQPGPDGEMFVRVAGQEWHIFAANLTRADSTGPQEKREEAPKPPAAPPPPRPPPPQPLWGCRAVQLLCLARGPPRGRGLDLLAEAGGFRFGSIVDAWQAQEDSWRRMSANAATLGYASDARLSIGGPQGVQHVTGLSAVRDFWGRVFAALAPQQGDWVGPPGDPPPERRAHLLPGGLVIAATWSCPGRGFSSVEERLTFSPSTWRITEHSVILE